MSKHEKRGQISWRMRKMIRGANRVRTLGIPAEAIMYAIWILNKVTVLFLAYYPLDRL